MPSSGQPKSNTIAAVDRSEIRYPRLYLGAKLVGYSSLFIAMLAALLFEGGFLAASASGLEGVLAGGWLPLAGFSVVCFTVVALLKRDALDDETER